jgi:hypothetical protein
MRLFLLEDIGKLPLGVRQKAKKLTCLRIRLIPSPRSIVPPNPTPEPIVLPLYLPI